MIDMKSMAELMGNEANSKRLKSLVPPPLLVLAIMSIAGSVQFLPQANLAATDDSIAYYSITPLPHRLAMRVEVSSQNHTGLIHPNIMSDIATSAPTF